MLTAEQHVQMIPDTLRSRTLCMSAFGERERLKGFNFQVLQMLASTLRLQPSSREGNTLASWPHPAVEALVRCVICRGSSTSVDPQACSLSRQPSMPGASGPCPTFGLGKLPSSLGTGSSSQRSLDFAGMAAL